MTELALLRKLKSGQAFGVYIYVYMGNSIIADVTFRLNSLNFNLAQTKYKKKLTSFPFMNMFLPIDMLT